MRLFLLLHLLLPCFSQELYTSLTPCRLLDTRETGTSLKALETRVIKAHGSCGIPETATSLFLNATVIPVKILGFLTLWPTSPKRPNVSLLNSLDGSIRSNGTILGLSSGSLSAYATDETHLILDISGYFSSAPVSLPPDTRADRIQLGPGVCSLRTRESTGYVRAFFKCGVE